MLGYFNSKTYKFDGVNAGFFPHSENLSWSLVPEHKITVEDIKYIYIIFLLSREEILSLF